MWQAICLTLTAAAGNNIGKVFQKKGTTILPPFSFKLKVMRAYVMNRTWLFGVLMDIVGALLLLCALSLAPVSVIQPVAGCGLAIHSIFSYFYLHEVMNTLDWVGITLAGIGTIGVGLGGEDQEVPAISLYHLPFLGFIVAILFALLNFWLRLCNRQKRDHDLIHFEVVEEIIFGLESGIMSGMAAVMSKFGFLFLEQGFSTLLLLVCLLLSVGCTLAGFAYQTRGFSHGRAIVISTCAAVAGILTGVLAGIFALGERLPSDSMARFFLFLGWFFIMVGVLFLVCSARIISLVTRPWRRFPSRGAERTPRRSGSIRVRESGPSTVIPANTLHQLISSPAKPKA